MKNIYNLHVIDQNSEVLPMFSSQQDKLQKFLERTQNGVIIKQKYKNIYAI